MQLVDNVVVIKEQSNYALEVIEKVKGEISPDTKLFCFYETEGLLSIGACRYRPEELLWAFESLKLSLLSGKLLTGE